MTEHSDTANTVQSARVDWGSLIETHRKRLPFLVNGEPFRCGCHGWVCVVSDTFGWENVTSLNLPADHPHYRPTNTLTIPRMTEAEAREYIFSPDDLRSENVAVQVLRSLGIIADPTPTQLLSQHCNITEEQAARALAWCAENVK